MANYIGVYWCSAKLKSTFNILKHHYLSIPKYKIEFHPIGKYDKYLKLNAAASSEIHARAIICERCVLDFLDYCKKLCEYDSFYPILNCESVLCYLFFGRTFSIQTLLSILLLGSLALIWYDYKFIIVFLTILLYLFLHNNLFEIVTKEKIKLCNH